ncbi:hypothetical protein LAZ67_22002397, partial [Cordylochernes scorpioides]
MKLKGSKFGNIDMIQAESKATLRNLSKTLLGQRDKEIEELHSKIAEVMAVMPVTAAGTYPLMAYGAPPKFLPEDKLQSTLDPNAS